MTLSDEADLRRGAAGLGVEVDTATVVRLGRFLELLDVWNRRFHLTGDRERAVLVRKHLLDCLAVVPDIPGTGIVVDIGSGAGFPGLVLGCFRPDLPLFLIEPRRRPTSFLYEAVGSLPLPMARVVTARAEQAARDLGLGAAARIVVSRALRLDLLLDLAGPFLAPDGELVAMQTPSIGRSAAEDLARARGLALVRLRDYRLEGGEARRLLVFGLR